MLQHSFFHFLHKFSIKQTSEYKVLYPYDDLLNPVRAP